MGSNPTLSEKSNTCMTVFQKISQELWFRVFYCGLGFTGALGIHFWYISTWTTFLCLPISQLDTKAHFIFTDIKEGFAAACFLAIILSTQFSAPLFFYQTFSFLNPALFKHESFSYCMIAMTFIGVHVFFYVGFLTSWMHTLLGFFLQFQFETLKYPLVTFQAKVLTYFQFIVSWCISFQLFFILCFFSVLQFPHMVQKLWFNQKHFLIGSLSVALSLVLPPDGLLQLLVTGQLLCLADVLGFLLSVHLLYQEKLQTKAVS